MIERKYREKDMGDEHDETTIRENLQEYFDEVISDNNCCKINNSLMLTRTINYVAMQVILANNAVMICKSAGCVETH